MRNIGSSLAVDPASRRFRPSDILSPAVAYAFHDGGDQSCLLGKGPTLLSFNTAGALGSGHLLDFNTDTIYRNNSADPTLEALFDFNTLPVGGSIIVGCEIMIPVFAAASYIMTYGIDSSNGMAIAVLNGASPHLRLVSKANGQTGTTTSSSFLDTGLASSVTIGIVLEIYLKSSSLCDLVCYVNGSSNGTLVDHDLLGDGSSLPNSGTHHLTIGARRSGTSTFSNYWGADASSFLSNFVAVRQNSRNSLLAQDLSGWLKNYPGEKPIPLMGV